MQKKETVTHTHKVGDPQLDLMYLGPLSTGLSYVIKEPALLILQVQQHREGHLLC